MKLTDTIKLWMLGLGIPLALLENERVKFELAQDPIDGAGLLQSFKSAIYSIPSAQTVEARANLEDAATQLKLITLVNSNGAEMLMFNKK